MLNLAFRNGNTDEQKQCQRCRQAVGDLHPMPDPKAARLGLNGRPSPIARLPIYLFGDFSVLALLFQESIHDSSRKAWKYFRSFFLASCRYPRTVTLLQPSTAPTCEFSISCSSLKKNAARSLNESLPKHCISLPRTSRP